MLPLIRDQIAKAFDGDDELFVPDLNLIEWSSLDFLGWVHPSGHLGFVVFQSPNNGRTCGVRMSRAKRSRKKQRIEMCSWCHHVHKPNGTAFFTVSVKGSEGRRSLGNFFCKDLDCSLRIRNILQPNSLMSETLYEPAKVWRLQTSMHRWLGRANRL